MRQKVLEMRCNERGYKLEDVEPCIVKRDGETLWVDERHEKYPTPAKMTNHYVQRNLSKRWSRH